MTSTMSFRAGLKEAASVRKSHHLHSTADHLERSEAIVEVQDFLTQTLTPPADSFMLPPESNNFVSDKNNNHIMLTEDDQSDERWGDTFSLIGNLFSLSANPISIVELCDRVDIAKPNSRELILLNLRRQSLLATMLQNDRNVYLETVKFVGPRIPRRDLPNLQG